MKMRLQRAISGATYTVYTIMWQYNSSKIRHVSVYVRVRRIGGLELQAGTRVCSHTSRSDWYDYRLSGLLSGVFGGGPWARIFGRIKKKFALNRWFLRLICRDGFEDTMFEAKAKAKAKDKLPRGRVEA